MPRLELGMPENLNPAHVWACMARCAAVRVARRRRQQTRHVRTGAAGGQCGRREAVAVGGAVGGAGGLDEQAGARDGGVGVGAHSLRGRGSG